MSSRASDLMRMANQFLDDEPQDVASKIPSARSRIVPTEEEARQAVAQYQQEQKQEVSALAVRSDNSGAIWIGNFCLSPCGLEIPAETDEASWLEIGRVIHRFSSTLAWFWGDWIAYGAAHFSNWTDDAYQHALAQSGYEYATLRDYAYVARNVPLSIRIDNLSFAHHRAVASMSEWRDQKTWLDRAVERGWSAATLARQIERASNPRLVAGAKRGKNPLLDRSTKKAFNSVWKAVEAGAGINKEDVKRIKAWVREIEEMLNAK